MPLYLFALMLSTHTINIAVFASGAGSNAQKIIEHFKQSSTIKISLIVCNKPNAGVLSIASTHHIPSLLIEKEKFFNDDIYIKELQKHKINFIVLAGFLWKVPSSLINAYAGKIINIHPALLPKYGGKGMYGIKVHEAVIENKEKESGITIHFVDEQYDHGKTIFQTTCAITENDTPEMLAAKVHALEHEFFAKVIEEVVGKLN
jgi:phosphoribosylglycinamide formyltransferase-1